MKAKISVITPSVRKDFLPIVEKCLSRQTTQDYEWIVVSPKDYGFGIWVQDPPLRQGDFYGLNKAWNAGILNSEGKLFVSIVDGMWFPPDTLERLLQHYERDNMSCIGLVGHQYEGIENGKPEYRVWTDPRVSNVASFYEIPPYDLEFCIASVPMEGIKKVGGFDEEFDKFPAWSEKDLACRLASIGYKCYIDQGIEYRAIYHPRLNDAWDRKYPESSSYFLKCYEEIKRGERLFIDGLKKPYRKDKRFRS